MLFKQSAHDSDMQFFSDYSGSIARIFGLWHSSRLNFMDSGANRVMMSVPIWLWSFIGMVPSHAVMMTGLP